MQGLFRGWRRWCGAVTLVLAFMALGGWVRSLTIADHLAYRGTNDFYSFDSNLGTFRTSRSKTFGAVNSNLLTLPASVTFNTVSIQPASGPLVPIANTTVPTMTSVLLAVDSTTVPTSPVNAAVFVGDRPTISAAIGPNPVASTDDNIAPEELTEDSSDDLANEPEGFTECAVGSNLQVLPNPAGSTILVLNTAPSISPFRWVTTRAMDRSHFLSGMPIASEWKFFGVHYALMRMDTIDCDGLIQPLSKTVSLTVPYWIVSIPLILLTAYLLFSTRKLALQPTETTTLPNPRHG